MSMGCQIKTSCEVKSVSSFNGGHRLLGVDDSEEIYDRCIFGVNAHKALKILGTEATNEELQILGSFQYVYSPTYLHRDKGLMPRNSSAWSSLNFLRTTNGDAFVTYWLNVLQNIGSTGTLLVTLNPPDVPDHFLLKWCTSHPVPSVTTAKATLELDEIQGKRGIWFCGAYQGYGFHEDGLKAGRAAAEGVARKNCCLFMNRRQIIPSWKEAGARLVVTRFLDQHITIGNLILLEEGGTMLSFGKTCAKCCVKSILRVHNPLFYWKVATEADLGLADAYINGLISFVDKQEGLLNLFLILIANRDAQKSTSSNTSKRGWWTPVLTTAGVASAKYFLRHMSRKNTITQARRNISEHYDLSNDFFSLFLDPTMTYSCATFMMENENLEAAQLRKVGALVEKAKVNQNHEVLEIGCGWGCFAIEVVKQTGCKYTGITLSEEQLKYSKRKVKESGLEDHITFLLCDYRHVPSSRKYDRIISIEMVEAVGHEYMEDFFGCCESLLAEDGLLVLQFSSIPDTRYNEYRRSSEFLKEYVFPGLCVPCFSHIVSAMSAASRLCVEHVENIADNYCRTLTCWRDNLMANKDKIIALGFDEKLIRKFEYYFMYTASGFKSRTFEEYVIVFSRPGNRTAFSDPYASFPAA